MGTGPPPRTRSSSCSITARASGTTTSAARLDHSGELARLIAEDGLRGITSNPSIWEKAIAGSTDYADAIEALRRAGETDPKAVYERLAIQDIRDAADAFRPVYEQTGRRDGFVSIEVSPDLAHDTEERSPRRSGCGARSSATT